ncbi:tyrosine-type recombinase/integrase [Actinoallomurus sp. NBC_01490]|uniref:tyrosine-type recombinase/integrase n=1 Tax=Actinoallomurus sp. NBC_01490 TaxID=2903557 RepID=UPI002E30A6FD|nr:tyrosine-type recombinase/integrase [Actinoallomurus sp. NBC_01490]
MGWRESTVGSSSGGAARSARLEGPASTPHARRACRSGRPAAARSAGVREVRVHDTRHTTGTMLIEQEVNIRVVQEVLGHTRVTTTERYTHVAAAQVQDAGNWMGAAL